MKRSIAKKIESLLAASTSPDPEKKDGGISKKSGIKISGSRIGKFCRQLPISLFNLIRPAPKLDFNQDGKV